MAAGENPRVYVSDEALLHAIETIGDSLKRRTEQKGRYSYASNHEGLGLITEEFLEYVNAITSNDNEHIKSELVDIAVGCIFALASMKAKNV